MAFLGEDGMLGDVTQEAVDSVGKGGGEPVQAGWYRAVLLEDEAQPKSWGTGLSQQFQIIDGPFSERRVFDYLCIRHSTSEKAEEIARAKLKALAIAVGAKNPNDVSNTDILKRKPIMMEVRREEQDDAKYADEDGRKAKPANFVSCDEFKAMDAATPSPVPTNSPGAEPPPPSDADNFFN